MAGGPRSKKYRISFADGGSNNIAELSQKVIGRRVSTCAAMALVAKGSVILQRKQMLCACVSCKWLLQW